MGTAKIAGWMVGALLAVVAVGGAGFYLGSNYRIVPVGEPQPPSMPPAPSFLGLPAPPAPPTFVAPSSNKGDGPFSYRFTAGEVTGYTLEADVSGTGSERDLGASSIGLGFKAQFDLATTTVAHDGMANLKLNFNTADLVGQFMGDEVKLHHGPEGSSFEMPGQREVRNAPKDQLDKTPQMQFFKHPIEMSVGPDGRVLSVKGVDGFEQVLVPEPLVAAVGFPESKMAPGYHWESDFKLPIPGFDLAVPAKATNTFDGYVDIGGRSCAAIHQVIDSSQTDGKISSPGAFFAQAMNFTMPSFKLTGDNYIYFDTELGKMRQASMDLTVSLEIGKELDVMKKLIGAYTQQLDALDHKSSKSQEEGEQALMDLGFHITSTLALQDGSSGL